MHFIFEESSLLVQQMTLKGYYRRDWVSGSVQYVEKFLQDYFFSTVESY